MPVNRAEIQNRLGNDLFLKFDAFIGSTDLSEIEFSDLMFSILKTEAFANVVMPAPVSKVISTIKFWAILLLDPKNSSF